jgi:hypothetical protein
MRCRRIERRLALLALAVAGAGCAVRGGELAETPWPLDPPASKKSLSLALTAGPVILNEDPVDVPASMVGIWRKQVEETYVDSGLFASVLESGSPTDLRAEVRISDVGRWSRPLAIVSGLTLYLIPCSGVERFSMRTDFKNADGDLLVSVERSDSVTYWQQMFLVFALPFEMPDTVTRGLLRDLARATLEEAQAKGVM